MKNLRASNNRTVPKIYVSNLINLPVMVNGVYYGTCKDIAFDGKGHIDLIVSNTTYNMVEIPLERVKIESGFIVVKE